MGGFDLVKTKIFETTPGDIWHVAHERRAMAPLVSEAFIYPF